ncbi:hypothetical protein FFLO_05405 [Filobasidium floriforme]|uniref:Uncharacterized protein n=1 Tax=Filobasidium floriforme TaxID=5210 RepID=A0A8K0JME5_9TREE|nr:uncharacterized protein HD553DRAFT_326578 [Filobasidium floriforme]KAG7529765.1 hypothetical protein FFLO_05405 [Filobasidium floriforme]KAH8079348.1 hypothetical protein HD553DRAFT_326578 [Filobasidium floriforme]
MARSPRLASVFDSVGFKVAAEDSRPWRYRSYVMRKFPVKRDDQQGGFRDYGRLGTRDWALYAGSLAHRDRLIPDIGPEKSRINKGLASHTIRTRTTCLRLQSYDRTESGNQQRKVSGSCDQRTVAGAVTWTTMRSVSGAGEGQTANLHPENRDNATMNRSESKDERRKEDAMDDSWSAPYAIYTLGRVVRNLIWWMILRPAMLVAYVHVEGCKRQWTID